jgi:multidrug transporter EmrE-like cation transporter
VLLATVLALASAALHAGWNLAVKQATGDRYVALWGAFTVTAPPTLLIVALYPPVGAALPWAAVSGLAHVPYCWLLARGYDRGDYSVVYPIARGGGAALGGIGGFLFLHDRVSALGLLAIGVIVLGLLLLPERRRGSDITAALGVACTIAVYSVADATGIRTGGSWHVGWRYVSASFLAGSIAISVFGLLLGKGRAMREGARTDWRRFVLVGSMSKVTYAMVQFAMRLAPVGYVSALRESSVVVASVIGWKFLGEARSARRVWCSLMVGAGLVLLVIAR